MKTFSHDLRYEGATLEQVYGMLQQQAFRDAVCEYQRYTSRDIDITPRGEGMVVRISQSRPASEVPGFARRLVGSEITVVQEEEWASPAEATLAIAIPGAPGSMTGQVRMAEVDGGVTESVVLQVKVGVPLIGGKVEDFVGAMIVRALKAENKVGVRWLADGKA